MTCHRHWKSVAVMVAINVAFAIVNLLLKKVLDKGVNGLPLVAYRQSISAIFMIPIACIWESRIGLTIHMTLIIQFSRRKSRVDLTAGILCYLFFSALIGVTLTQYLFLLGLKYTSATFASAFINMVPVNTFILAVLFRLEKLKIKSKDGKAKVFGTLICISGALLLSLYRGMPLVNSHSVATAQSTSHNKETKRWALGSVLTFAGCLMWSSWFLIQGRISEKYPHHCSGTAILNSFGAIQSAILSLIIERNITMWFLKGKLEIITIMYAGMVCSGLCYVGMSWCVKQKGPVFTAAFTPFTQIFVAVFDFSILHEQIYLGSVLGSVCVIIGMYTLLWGKSKEAKECIRRPVDCTPLSTSA